MIDKLFKGRIIKSEHMHFDNPRERAIYNAGRDMGAHESEVSSAIIGFAGALCTAASVIFVNWLRNKNTRQFNDGSYPELLEEYYEEFE